MSMNIVQVCYLSSAVTRTDWFDFFFITAVQICKSLKRIYVVLSQNCKL